jgi:hypothetical protein
MKDEMMWKMKSMRRMVKMNFDMSIAFSVFGMLLIFGLGFVFPSINPYVVIKWIIIVASVVFAYAFITFAIFKVMKIRMKMTMKGEWKKASKK